jgi:hypothetical protein
MPGSRLASGLITGWTVMQSNDSIFWVLRFDPGINRGGKVLTIRRGVQDTTCQIKS